MQFSLFNSYSTAGKWPIQVHFQPIQVPGEDGLIAQTSKAIAGKQGGCRVDKW